MYINDYSLFSNASYTKCDHTKLYTHLDTSVCKYKLVYDAYMCKHSCMKHLKHTHTHMRSKC